MRRALCLAIIGLLLLTLKHEALAADTSKTAGAMTQAAAKFLDSLDSAPKAKAALKFDDPARMKWHNIPMVERKGLQLGAMSAKQKELCHALLRTALSENGYKQVTQIISLENILHVIPTAPFETSMYGPDHYYLAIYGEPAMKGTWGWSFEGHHISLNLVIRDGQVIADTPNFFGANPVIIYKPQDGSPPEGTRTLAREEQLAFELLGALDDAQRKRAIIAERSPRDYRNPGQTLPPQAAPVGLPAAEMTAEQKQRLEGLLEAYSGNLTAELAAQRMEVVKKEIDRVYFAWAGGNKEGVAHFYRVQGPTFYLELCNAQDGAGGQPANHIHSVWRNLTGDFAVPIK